MRKPIIIANWKMYKTRAEAKAFCEEFLPMLTGEEPADVAICAPFTDLGVLSDALQSTVVGLGAQNFYPEQEGAFTGEISLPMLQEFGVQYAVVGHSERRQLFHESDEMIHNKITAAYHAGIQPILCVGEGVEQKEAGETLSFCGAQLRSAMNGLQRDQIETLIVAYEPIWAIGTGKAAGAEEAQEVIGALRRIIAEQYGNATAQKVRMLYGGSVKPKNIQEFMAKPDIDGALVGGASLKPDSFYHLVADCMPKEKPKCVTLMILDGWGKGSECATNAIYQAKTPNMDNLMQQYPNTMLYCSGEHVGLPEGQQGNSEVGHLNLGAGRVVYQELTRINKAVREHTLEQNEALGNVMHYCSENGKALHMMGLVSPGGVHSHTDHLYGLLEMAKRAGLEKVYVHCFLDGRDVGPSTAGGFLAELENKMKEIGVGTIASVSGRYYAMDRDKRWDRVEKAYRVMTEGKGESAASALEAVEKSYAKGETDEFVLPTAILQADGTPVATVQPEDGMIFFNFRGDRAREITHAFVDHNFEGFERKNLNVHYVAMTQYEEGMNAEIAFPPQDLKNTLGQVLAQNNVRQFRIAETEKYAHVTFFFNGGVEDPNPLEERLLIPSPKVATYDLQPEMSAEAVKEGLVQAIQSGKYPFLLVNFANPDMVGHTGIQDAAVKAVETVDRCVGEVASAVKAAGGVLLITADHGNAEQMVDPVKGTPHTAHTSNPVPFIAMMDGEATLQQGSLQDVAPTVLQLLGLEKPEEMTGNSLILG